MKTSWNEENVSCYAINLGVKHFYYSQIQAFQCDMKGYVLVIFRKITGTFHCPNLL